ncbi:hypothetical protein AN958_09738 [Leucoagaricus sp. SymC.cos]|nr:hypothetical protein AN958_09738 [Leucoagaricus sp. SymC.cos]
MGKKKLKRNISGLRNQSQNTTELNPASDDNQEPADEEPSLTNWDDDEPHDGNTWERHPDDIKSRWEPESHNEESVEDEGIYIEGVELAGAGKSGVGKKSLQAKMVRMAAMYGDDPQDEDWVPARVKWKIVQRRKCMTGPIQRKKGPDVGSKSASTRYRHRELLCNQVNLEYCGFKPLPPRQKTLDDTVTEPVTSETDNVMDLTLDSDDDESVERTDEVINDGCDGASWPDESSAEPEVTVESLSGHVETQLMKQKRLESDISGSEFSDSEFECDENGDDLGGECHNGSDDVIGDVQPELGGDGLEKEDLEDWEDELEEIIVPKGADVQSWAELRTQIIDDLNRKYKTLPLSQINQLMIL